MEKLLIKDNLNNTVQDFPNVLNKREIIYYHFRDEMGHDDQVLFVLYEYHLKNRKGIMRWKKYARWQKGWTLAFNPSSDYVLKRGIKYRLEVTYKNNNNEELKDIAYFKL
tara:strand:- start:522 stop:851 length:330 start_codon:yes stop_codon:yes gene_type:complete